MMMVIQVKNRRRFERELDKFADSLELDVVTVQKKLAFDIFGDIVAGTPIRTGRAMNNWNISIGTPDRSTVESGGSITAITSSKSAIALSEVAGLEPFQTVWISNNLEYIVFLEEGSSDQAPDGWVERAINNNLDVFLEQGS